MSTPYLWHPLWNWGQGGGKSIGQEATGVTRSGFQKKPKNRRKSQNF